MKNKNDLWLIVQIVKENVEHFELIIYSPKKDEILFSWNSEIDNLGVWEDIKKAIEELEEDNSFGIVEVIYKISRNIEIEKAYGEALCGFVEMEKHIDLKEKRELYSKLIVFCPNKDVIERGCPDTELQEVANRLL